MAKTGRAIVVVALLIALIVPAAVMASGQKETAGTGEAAKTGFDKRLVITWTAPSATQIVDGNWVEAQLEQRFNVDIKVKKMDMSNVEQRNLILASGEMTDLWFPYGNPKEMWDNGLLRSVPFSMIRQYSPNYAKMLDDTGVAWLTSLVPGKKDEFMAPPGYSAGIEGPAFSSFYRLDWLEKLGIKPHGTLQEVYKDRMWWTTEPFTMKEAEQIFDKFVNGDPDGNGKADTYALTGYKSDLLWNFINVANSFGFCYNKNMMEDGQLKEYYITKGYKDFLKWGAGMYKKGLIDKELTILDLNKVFEKIAAGTVGYWIAPYTYVSTMPTAATTTPPNSILFNDPKSKVLVTPPEIGTYGKPVGYYYMPVVGLSYNLFFNKAVDDEKLARILQIVDYVNFDKDARVWSMYGEEGKNWKWAGEKYNSWVQPLQAFNGPEEMGKSGTGSYRWWGVWPADWCAIIESPQLGVVSKWIRDPNQGGKIAWRPYRHDLFGETKLVDINKQYASELSSQRVQFAYKAITGELDVDSEWDNYVKKLMSSGLDKVLAELQKAPIVEDLRKGVVKY